MFSIYWDIQELSTHVHVCLHVGQWNTMSGRTHIYRNMSHLYLLCTIQSIPCLDIFNTLTKQQVIFRYGLIYHCTYLYICDWLNQWVLMDVYYSRIGNMWLISILAHQQRMSGLDFSCFVIQTKWLLWVTGILPPVTFTAERPSITDPYSLQGFLSCPILKGAMKS